MAREAKISKEDHVRWAVNESYLPILGALEQEYPGRYPRVCGPYGYVLTRSPWFRRTGIPLRLGGDCERFELEIGIFNPPSSAPFQPDEHTYIRYYTATGDVFYIDGIYQLLWGQNAAPVQPLIEKYREDEIDQKLAERYSLFPYSERLATQLQIDLWSGLGDTPPEPMKDYCDVRALMHGSQVLEGMIELDSGVTRGMRDWGQRVTRVLQALGEAP